MSLEDDNNLGTYLCNDVQVGGSGPCDVEPEGVVSHELLEGLDAAESIQLLALQHVRLVRVKGELALHAVSLAGELANK